MFFPFRKTHFFILSLFLLASVFPRAYGDQAWQIFSSSRRNYKVADCASLAPETAQRRPFVTEIQSGENEYSASIYPEKDAGARDGRGDVIIAWTCTVAGNYRVTAKIRNPGLDVKGGDGGHLSCTLVGAGKHLDVNQAFSVRIPVSRENAPWVSGEDSLKLNDGDQVRFRFRAGIDGYGDCFETRLSVTPTDTQGRTIPQRGWEAFLPNPPPAKKADGLPLRKGLFWVGVSGGWAHCTFAPEALAYIKKEIPDLGMIMISHRPDAFPQVPWFKDLEIPTIIQSFGSGYEPYFDSQDAFERDWAGTVLDASSSAPLAGSAHAVSLPHPATYRAFSLLGQSAIRSGYSGHGFCDMVWMWGAGRGCTGYHPETIAAFRRALQKQDEGLRLQFAGKKPQTFFFKDYAAYYLGGMPSAKDLGFKSWKDYTQVSRTKFYSRPLRDWTPDQLLFDMLCSYEWLRLAQFLGKNAEDEGGFFQCMPNPEDMANGCDLLFLCGLRDVRVVTEEFFQSPRYLDGAYFHWDYFRSKMGGDRQLGAVMESAGGGNAPPYYDLPLAFLNAYELTVAAQLDTMEADFWPGNQISLKQMQESEPLRLRSEAILNYGRGFQQARKDGFKPIAADFAVISSRRIFRPWGKKWRPWTYHLDQEGAMDSILASRGYHFAGMGEEAILHWPGKHDTLVYSPSLPTEAGFRALLKLLESGKVKIAYVPADCLKKIVTAQFRTVSFRTVFPELEQNLTIKGEFAEKIVGKGRLIIVPECVRTDSATMDKLARKLAEDGLSQHWQADKGVMVRIYENGDTRLISLQHPNVRNWTDETMRTNPEIGRRYAPLQLDGGMTARVRLKPGQTYHWTTIPAGKHGTVTANADGWTRLKSTGVVQQLFVLSPNS